MKRLSYLFLAILLLSSVAAFSFELSYVGIDIRNVTNNRKLNGTMSWNTYIYTSSQVCSGTPTNTHTSIIMARNGSFVVNFNYTASSSSFFIKGGLVDQNYSCFRYTADAQSQIANNSNNLGGVASSLYATKNYVLTQGYIKAMNTSQFLNNNTVKVSWLTSVCTLITGGSGLCDGNDNTGSDTDDQTLSYSPATDTISISEGNSIDISELHYMNQSQFNDNTTIKTSWIAGFGYITDGNTNWDNSYGFAKNGTVNNGKLCFWDNSGNKFNCTYTDASGGNSTEQMQDAVGSGFERNLIYNDTDNSYYANTSYWTLYYVELSDFNTSDIIMVGSEFGLNYTKLNSKYYLASNPSGYISTYINDRHSHNTTQFTDNSTIKVGWLNGLFYSVSNPSAYISDGNTNWDNSYGFITKTRYNGTQFTNSSGNLTLKTSYLNTFVQAVAVGGEVSGTVGSITIGNDALDDQYYDSESDLTTLLNDNYQAQNTNKVKFNGTQMTNATGNLTIKTGWLDNIFVGQSEYPNLDTDSTNDFNGAFSSLTGTGNVVENSTAQIGKICIWQSNGLMNCTYTDQIGAGGGQRTKFNHTQFMNDTGNWSLKDGYLNSKVVMQSEYPNLDIDNTDDITSLTQGSYINITGSGNTRHIEVNKTKLDADFVGQSEYPNLDTDSTNDLVANTNKVKFNGTQMTNATGNLTIKTPWLNTFVGGVAVGGEVSGTVGSITINNDALDDQYYDSESDLTTLLNDNYQAQNTNKVKFNGTQMTNATGNLTIKDLFLKNRCEIITGSAALCDGTDATGASTNIFNQTLNSTSEVKFNTTQITTKINGSAEISLVRQWASADVPTIAGTGDDTIFLFDEEGNLRIGENDKFPLNPGNLDTACYSIGYDQVCTGISGTTLGADNDVGGSYSIALGQNVNVSGSNSIGMGKNIDITGQFGFAMGLGTKALTDYCFAFGDGAECDSDSGFAIGEQTRTFGDGGSRFQVALGGFTTANGTHSGAGSDGAVAIGTYLYSEGDGTVIIGSGDDVNNYTNNKEPKSILFVNNGVKGLRVNQSLVEAYKPLYGTAFYDDLVLLKPDTNSTINRMVVDGSTTKKLTVEQKLQDGTLVNKSVTWTDLDSGAGSQSRTKFNMTQFSNVTGNWSIKDIAVTQVGDRKYVLANTNKMKFNGTQLTNTSGNLSLRLGFLTSSCAAITGSSALCDGTDATGSGDIVKANASFYLYNRTSGGIKTVSFNETKLNKTIRAIDTNVTVTNLDITGSYPWKITLKQVTGDGTILTNLSDTWTVNADEYPDQIQVTRTQTKNITIRSTGFNFSTTFNDRTLNMNTSDFNVNTTIKDSIWTRLNNQYRTLFKIGGNNKLEINNTVAKFYANVSLKINNSIMFNVSSKRKNLFMNSSGCMIMQGGSNKIAVC